MITCAALTVAVVIVCQLCAQFIGYVQYKNRRQELEKSEIVNSYWRLSSVNLETIFLDFIKVIA